MVANFCLRECILAYNACMIIQEKDLPSLDIELQPGDTVYLYGDL